MPVEPIRPKRLYREVADQITSLIDKEDLKPGERLPAERELAASLEVRALNEAVGRARGSGPR
jgi:DNA-binding FadR family transcriptional regulator